MPLKYLSRGSQTNRGHLISVQGVFFSRYSWLIWLVVGRHTSQCVRSQEALSHLPSNRIYVDARIHHHYFCCFVDSGLEFSPWRIVSTTVQFSLGWASTKSANRFHLQALIGNQIRDTWSQRSITGSLHISERYRWMDDYLFTKFKAITTQTGPLGWLCCKVALNPR